MSDQNPQAGHNLKVEFVSYVGEHQNGFDGICLSVEGHQYVFPVLNSEKAFKGGPLANWDWRSIKWPAEFPENQKAQIRHALMTCILNRFHSDALKVEEGSLVPGLSE